MISNEISLSHVEKMAAFTQTNLLSIRKIFNNHVMSRFPQQSAEYLGSTLSHQEIESLMDQESKVRS